MIVQFSVSSENAVKGMANGELLELTGMKGDVNWQRSVRSSF